MLVSPRGTAEDPDLSAEIAAHFSLTPSITIAGS
jgi:hypothetical protein